MSPADLARLKKTTDLVAVATARGVKLAQQGHDFVALCPFHREEIPSFHITPAKHLFHCFGCGAAGSAIDLVMRLDGLSFKAAVDKLLIETGVVQRGAGLPPAAGGTAELAPPPPPPPPAKAQTLAPERAQVLLERIVSVYARNLQEGLEGKAYLARRGLTDAGLWTRHRVGYSNGRLPELLPKEGEIWDELEALGILLANGQERFTGCVVFPVSDGEGHLVTLYGRYTGEGDKRHLYLPGRPTGLWNAPVLKTYAHLILVESILDALSVMMAGQANVVSIQGTHGLNGEEAALLSAHGVQRITLLLDGDEAGRTATEKLSRLLANHRCDAIVLPEGHDPNSYLLAHGAPALARVLAHGHLAHGHLAHGHPADGDAPYGSPAHASPAHGEPTLPAISEPPGVNSGRAGPTTAPAGLAESATPTQPSQSAPSLEPAPVRLSPGSDGLAVTLGLRRYEIRGLEKGPRKLRATVRVERAGKLHVDTLDFYSAKARRQLAQDLCRVLDEAPETIEADLGKLIALGERAEPAPDPAQPPTPLASMAAADRQEAEAFGRSPDLLERILADYERCGLVGERHNKLLCYLAMTSRKLAKPLSVLILSSSGAGKTMLQDTALEFCPPEDLVKLTSLSGKALFYKEQSSLKNKVLALEEGDGVEEATYALRNLISAGELTIESTIKDLVTGKLTTMENRVEGPTAVFVTTTNPDTDAETRSRFWVTSVDESREQTQAILASQRQRQTLAGLAEDTAATLHQHRNFQRLLQPLAVVNPYADQLTYGDDRLQSRRDQPKYLNLIQAVALLRQLRKPVKTWGVNGVAQAYVEVDKEDLRLANDLASAILGHSLDELSRPGYDLLMQLERLARGQATPAPPATAGPPATSTTAEVPSAAKRKTGGSHAGGPQPNGGLHASGFTRRQIRERTGWSQSRVHRYLQELIELEYVAVESGRNGLLQTYRLSYQGEGKDGQKFVLGLKAVDQLHEPAGAGP